LGLARAPTESRETFTDLGAIPFASRTRLTVSAAPGGGKVNPFIFSLPGGSFTTPATPFVRKPLQVVGLDQQAALEKLEAAGFEVLVVPVYSRQTAGRVLGTRTGRGIGVTGAPSGPVVEITASNGKKTALEAAIGLAAF
jgi:hypothetical protein